MLASLVLPQPALTTQSPCLKVRPPRNGNLSSANWLNCRSLSLFIYYSKIVIEYPLYAISPSHFSGKVVPISGALVHLVQPPPELAFIKYWLSWIYTRYLPPQNLWLVYKCFLDHKSIFSSIFPLPFKARLLKQSCLYSFTSHLFALLLSCPRTVI